MKNLLTAAWERLIWKYLPAEERVLRLRKRGLELIRHEAVRRARAALKVRASVHAQWASDASRLLSPAIDEEPHILTLSVRDIDAQGHFPDWAVVLYPSDSQCVDRVEHELRRVLGAICSSKAGRA